MHITDKLNDLIALDLDAVHAYEAAIKRLEAVDLRTQLRQFQMDHERHIHELSAVVMRLGGKPRTKPDVKGFFIQGFTAMNAMMGDAGALRAMKGNEELTTKTYRNALDNVVWPDDIRALIVRNYEDEQRHLQFVLEALKLRREFDEARPHT